jgi:hypothetical protein
MALAACAAKRCRRRPDGSLTGEYPAGAGALLSELQPDVAVAARRCELARLRDGEGLQALERRAGAQVAGALMARSAGVTNGWDRGPFWPWVIKSIRTRMVSEEVQSRSPRVRSGAA